MKRKLFSLCLAMLLVVIWIMPQVVLGDTGPTLSLSLNKDKVNPGEEVQVTVAGNGFTDLYGFEVNLDFDPSQLQYKNGGVLTPWDAAVPPQGFSIDPIVEGNHLKFAHTKMLNVPGDNGNLTLCTLTFVAKSSGSTAIKLTNAKLVDSNLGSTVVNSNAQVSATINSQDDGDGNGNGDGSTDGSGGTDSGNNGNGNAAGLKLQAALDSSSKTATAALDAAAWDKAVQQSESDGSKKIRVEIAEVPDASAYMLQLPASAISDPVDQLQIEIVSPLGTITVPGNMFKAGELPSGTIGLRIGKANTSLPDAGVKQQIGNHPVVDLSVAAGDITIPWNNPDAPVKVGIPYTPTANEDPEHITIWYIDGQGKANPVPNGRYDAKSGTVTFTTAHFSIYTVAYVETTFNDIQALDWAKKPIEVLASKGIVNGVSDTRFNPDSMVTRADFVVLLVRTLELKGAMGAQFSDVHTGDYYDEALWIARGLGITEGSGANRFEPMSPITRQDMIVLTDRALQAAKKGTDAASKDALAGFGDTSQIADYAVNSVASLVKAGIVHGFPDGIHPNESTNRAQAAVLMYNIYNSMTP